MHTGLLFWRLLCCNAQSLGTYFSVRIQLSSCHTWTCAIFSDQRLNPHSLHWQADSIHCPTRKVPEGILRACIKKDWFDQQQEEKLTVLLNKTKSSFSPQGNQSGDMKYKAGLRLHKLVSNGSPAPCPTIQNMAFDSQSSVAARRSSHCLHIPGIKGGGWHQDIMMEVSCYMTHRGFLNISATFWLCIIGQKFVMWLHVNYKKTWKWMLFSGGHMPGENERLCCHQKKKREKKERRQLMVYPGSSPSPDPHHDPVEHLKPREGRDPGNGAN